MKTDTTYLLMSVFHNSDGHIAILNQPLAKPFCLVFTCCFAAFCDLHLLVLLSKSLNTFSGVSLNDLH